RLHPRVPTARGGADPHDPGAARAGGQEDSAGQHRGHGASGGGGRCAGRHAHPAGEGTGRVTCSEENLRAEPEPSSSEVGPAGGAPLDVSAVREGMFGVHGSGETSGYGGLERVVSMPGPSPRPYGSYFDEIVDVLAEVLAEAGVDFDDAIEKVVVYREELSLYVAREHLPLVARSLRDDQDLRFELCLGVSGVHYPEDTGRELHAVYPLY